MPLAWYLPASSASHPTRPTCLTRPTKKKKLLKLTIKLLQKWQKKKSI